MKLDPRDNKRLLILRLRRQVKVHRRFDVEHLGGLRERHTCRECGNATIVTHHQVAPELMARLSRYRANGGVTGHCKKCSRIRAAERYPLPEERK